jgi:lysophospholipase L1-like esterase
MGYRLATATLGPLLLLQGRHVRRATPRLAEAAGPRDGTAGGGPPLRLLIVGDSAAAGVGVPVQGRALSGQLVAALAATHRVTWRLIARTGWTTRDLLAQMEAEPAARFDVAVTSLGVNDATDGVPPARWLCDQAALVALLSQRFGAAHVLLSAVPPMGRFPALPQPLRGYLGMRAQQLDTALAHWAASRDDCEHLPFAFPLEPGMMASDGFHPGETAYALWAAQVAAAIRRRFADTSAADFESA